MSFEIQKSFAVRKKITVDGKDYETLDEVPAEYRSALEKALGSDGAAAAKITVNGHTYAGKDLPAPMRALLGTLTLMALKKAGLSGEESSPVGAVRPEPVFSAKKIVILLALIILVAWIARSVR